MLGVFEIFRFLGRFLMFFIHGMVFLGFCVLFLNFSIVVIIMLFVGKLFFDLNLVMLF